MRGATRRDGRDGPSVRDDGDERALLHRGRETECDGSKGRDITWATNNVPGLIKFIMMHTASQAF